MKISPESFIVNEKLCLNFKSIFISGNDEGYIQSLTQLLISVFSNNGYAKKTISDSNVFTPDLFETKKNFLYISKTYLGEKWIKQTEEDHGVLIFYEKNTPKNKLAKEFFTKSKERALIECYELDQNRKKIILNSFVKKNNRVLNNDVYWFLLDLLDNRFVFLNLELEKLLLLDDINNAQQLIDALNPERATDANKFFFNIQLNRNNISSFIHSSINSLSDFYSYFSYFKIYSLMLISSRNKQELENKIPKYLFKEKGVLIDLFASLNENKKKLLSSLLYKTENLTRKNPNLCKSLFYRFVLNYKKIIS